MLKIVAALLLMWVAPALAQGGDPCTGQQFLSQPRPEGSCNFRPTVYPAPDQTMHALVFPVGMDLNASPDIESRVVMRNTDGKLLTSKDFSSPNGTNGFYVARAKWSPDSQFLVFSMSSSGGHSPWSFPTWVFSRDKRVIVSLNDMIDKPTLSDDFEFTGPHTIKAMTWKATGSETQVPIILDLAEAMSKPPPRAKK